MTDRKDKADSMGYGSVEEWIEFGETMEPEWDKAHKPRLKTEVLTIRLSPADMKRLRRLSERMGIGHSTLARMILRKALQQGEASIEEAATSNSGSNRWVLNV